MPLRTLDQRNLTFAVDSLPLNYDELKPYLAKGCTLFIDRNPRGNKLKHPVEASVPAGTSLGDLDVISFCLDALLCGHSKLIPFVLESKAMIELAKHLRRHKTSSARSLSTYVRHLHGFFEWLGSTPDKEVAKCLLTDGTQDERACKSLARALGDYLGELQAKGWAPSTRHVVVNATKTLFLVNEVELPKILMPTVKGVHRDRSPTSEELSRALDVADLREKVVISILALGGLRVGTLACLTYRHVVQDLESGVVPLHIHVEAEITKGKYADYDTFIAKEGVDCLRLYLDQRRNGSLDGDIPPEELTPESPLIRDSRGKRPLPTTAPRLCRIVRGVFMKAGLVRRLEGQVRPMYDLRPHSLRKYFRTQLTALGVPVDYVEFWMGHKISTYHDIEMKGIDFLRNIYAMSGFGVRPKAKVEVYDVIEEMLRAKGYLVDKDLLMRAVSKPHRTVVTGATEEDRKAMLRNAFIEMLKEEFEQVSRRPQA